MSAGVRVEQQIGEHVCKWEVGSARARVWINVLAALPGVRGRGASARGLLRENLLAGAVLCSLGRGRALGLGLGRARDAVGRVLGRGQAGLSFARGRPVLIICWEASLVGDRGRGLLR